MLGNTTLARIAALAVLLALVATACGNNRDNGAGGDGLSGTISGDGSSTVFPITEAVAEEFRAQNPGVDVTVGVSGTGGGFKKFCNGEIDIQDASRPIKDEEKQACESENIEWIEFEVANDGLAIVASTENTWADCLTTAELKRIWEPKSSVKTWKDVRAGFPAEELKLFGPGTDSGTFDYFTAEINGEEGASRTDYTASEDDNVLVQGVSGTKGGLGYFGYAYYTENKDKLKLLGVDSGTGCITPSDDAVQNNTYTPLSRPLYLYVKKASLERPEMKAFMDFYLENVNALVGDVGYTPLAEATLQAQKEKLQEATAA